MVNVCDTEMSDKQILHVSRPTCCCEVAAGTKLPAAKLYRELDASESKLEHREQTLLRFTGRPSRAKVLSPTAVSHFLRAVGPKLIQLPPRASKLALLSGLKRGASPLLLFIDLSVRDKLTALDSLRSRGSFIPLSLLFFSIFFWLALLLLDFDEGFTVFTELAAVPISMGAARLMTSECRLGIP